MSKRKVITVFEHQTLKSGQHYEGVLFDDLRLDAMERFYGENGVPYYSLINKGVKFNSFVGAIQVGDLLIQVLPKADQTDSDIIDKTMWRDMLIKMILTVRMFNIENPGSSSLKVIPNSTLDLYFLLFVQKVRFLLHTGLLKQYRKKEANVNSLKGAINFSRHLKENLIHKERFFVRHTTYDTEHKIHMIIYKALLLLRRINTNFALHGEIGALLLDFPEMPDIKVTDSTFTKIVYGRKLESYRDVISIARMILLNYHPDIKSGKNHVLALMFDMNMLWEKFIYRTLLKHLSDSYEVKYQVPRNFWKPEKGNAVRVRPDIVVRKREESFCCLIDAKWKSIASKGPSIEDLRQMYVYNDYFGGVKSALLYPGKLMQTSGLYFAKDADLLSDKMCALIQSPVAMPVNKWQIAIAKTIRDWIESELATSSVEFTNIKEFEK